MESNHSNGIAIKAVPDWQAIPASVRNRFTESSDKEVFGAYMDDEGVGLLILQYYPDMTCEICWIGVHPHQHNKGAGLALLNQAVESASHRQCRQIFARVLIDHLAIEQDSRQSFLSKNGFSSRPGFRPSIPHEATIWMVRDL